MFSITAATQILSSRSQTYPRPLFLKLSRRNRQLLEEIHPRSSKQRLSLGIAVHNLFLELREPRRKVLFRENSSSHSVVSQCKPSKVFFFARGPDCSEQRDAHLYILTAAVRCRRTHAAFDVFEGINHMMCYSPGNISTGARGEELSFPRHCCISPLRRVYNDWNY